MAAAAKLLLLSILASFLLLGVRADAGLAEDISDAGDSPLKLELEQLKSKILSLESRISERIQEIKSKDESIMQLVKAVDVKSASIASLQSEVESLQEKGAADANEEVGKAHARAGELERQIGTLKKEIEAQNRKRDALGVQAAEAERKMLELNSRLEKLQKINVEQQNIMRKTERALKVAQEELMRAQLEARLKSKQLTEIHGSWLPLWLETHMNYFEDLIITYWTEYGKPALELFCQKASEKSAQARRWVQPHLETAKTKWIPAVKEQWVNAAAQLKPHVQTVSTNTIQFYEVSKSKAGPHIVRLQEVISPYFQEAKKFSKPYINQVAVATKPHLERARVALKPYTKRATRLYRKFLKSTMIYHRQVQLVVMENLKKHEVTKSVASKELVWFLASTLLALPIFFFYRLLSAIFIRKRTKPRRNAHQHHASRRHKRRHTDK